MMLWKMHLLASQCDNNCLIMKQITSHALFQTLLLLVDEFRGSLMGDVLHSQMTRADHIINALEMTNEARQGERNWKLFVSLNRLNVSDGCVQDCTSSPCKFLAKSSFYSCIGVFLEMGKICQKQNLLSTSNIFWFCKDFLIWFRIDILGTSHFIWILYWFILVSS